MANESLGPIQIFEANPHQINDALREIVQRIDALQGLRGDSQVYGGFTVSGALTVSGTTTFAHASNVTSLTDSTAGTADDTVGALTDPADLPVTSDALRDDLVANLIPEIRNNFADLAAKVNAILTLLQGGY